MLKISVRGIAIAALFAPLFCFAGDGNIDEGAAGGVHKMNLKVAFLYEEAAPDDWKPLFEKASELLFDATEKQV